MLGGMAAALPVDAVASPTTWTTRPLPTFEAERQPFTAVEHRPAFPHRSGLLLHEQRMDSAVFHARRTPPYDAPETLQMWSVTIDERRHTSYVENGETAVEITSLFRLSTPLGIASDGHRLLATLSNPVLLLGDAFQVYPLKIFETDTINVIRFWWSDLGRPSSPTQRRSSSLLTGFRELLGDGGSDAMSRLMQVQLRESLLEGQTTVTNNSSRGANTSNNNSNENNRSSTSPTAGSATSSSSRRPSATGAEAPAASTSSEAMAVSLFCGTNEGNIIEHHVDDAFFQWAATSASTRQQQSLADSSRDDILRFLSRPSIPCRALYRGDKAVNDLAIIRSAVGTSTSNSTSSGSGLRAFSMVAVLDADSFLLLDASDAVWLPTSTLVQKRLVRYDMFVYRHRYHFADIPTPDDRDDGTSGDATNARADDAGAKRRRQRSGHQPETDAEIAEAFESQDVNNRLQAARRHARHHRSVTALELCRFQGAMPLPPVRPSVWEPAASTPLPEDPCYEIPAEHRRPFKRLVLSTTPEAYDWRLFFAYMAVNPRADTIVATADEDYVVCGFDAKVLFAPGTAVITPTWLYQSHHRPRKVLSIGDDAFAVGSEFDVVVLTPRPASKPGQPVQVDAAVCFSTVGSHGPDRERIVGLDLSPDERCLLVRTTGRIVTVRSMAWTSLRKEASHMVLRRCLPHLAADRAEECRQTQQALYAFGRLQCPRGHWLTASHLPVLPPGETAAIRVRMQAMHASLPSTPSHDASPAPALEPDAFMLPAANLSTPATAAATSTNISRSRACFGPVILADDGEVRVLLPGGDDARQYDVTAVRSPSLSGRLMPEIAPPLLPSPHLRPSEKRPPLSPFVCFACKRDLLQVQISQLKRSASCRASPCPSPTSLAGRAMETVEALPMCVCLRCPATLCMDCAIADVASVAQRGIEGLA